MWLFRIYLSARVEDWSTEFPIIVRTLSGIFVDKQLYGDLSPLPDVVPSVEAVGVGDVEVVHPDHDLYGDGIPDGILVGRGVTVHKRSYLHVKQVQAVQRGSVRSCKIK